MKTSQQVEEMVERRLVEAYRNLHILHILRID